jgi:hypothetical protein
MPTKFIPQKYDGKFNNLTEVTDEYILHVLKLVHPNATIDETAIEYLKKKLKPILEFSSIGNDNRVTPMNYNFVKKFLNAKSFEMNLLTDSIKCEMEKSKKKIIYMRYPIVDKLLTEILEHSGHLRNITFNVLNNIINEENILSKFFVSFDNAVKIWTES